MPSPIIQVENLSKLYRIGLREKANRTFREAMIDVFTAPLRNFNRLHKLNKFNDSQLGQTDQFNQLNQSNSSDTTWALRDVSFDILPGEVVGIIGRNGAGKSTLLKILSRITEPTSGEVRLHGRVASLLEVGTGFHPELTGRENIFLNGTILGMRKAEIDSKFDEIVAFSEIEKFLDTPVKRYSSGMYVRLAFAVAAHLEPEILLVDEVLAVGDAEFQKKCLGKMGDVAKEGRTVLFVSHNLSAIKRLCRTGIYLDSGRIELQGPVENVLAAYQSSQEKALPAIKPAINTSVINPGEARFLDWRVSRSSSGKEHACFSRELSEFSIHLLSRCRVPDAFIGFALWDSAGQLILGASSADNKDGYFNLNEGLYWLTLDINLPLKADTYRFELSLNSHSMGQLDRWSAVPNLTVLSNFDSQLPERWLGILNEPVQFHLNKAVSRSTNKEL